MAEKEYRHKFGMLWGGLGLFILGLVKYMGYNWEMALMVVGILAVIKSLACYGMKKK